MGARYKSERPGVVPPDGGAVSADPGNGVLSPSSALPALVTDRPKLAPSASPAARLGGELVEPARFGKLPGDALHLHMKAPQRAGVEAQPGHLGGLEPVELDDGLIAAPLPGERDRIGADLEVPLQRLLVARRPRLVVDHDPLSQWALVHPVEAAGYIARPEAQGERPFGSHRSSVAPGWCGGVAAKLTLAQRAQLRV